MDFDVASAADMVMRSLSAREQISTSLPPPDRLLFQYLTVAQARIEPAKAG
jgi:hypothetical protein